PLDARPRRRREAAHARRLPGPAIPEQHRIFARLGQHDPVHAEHAEDLLRLDPPHHAAGVSDHVVAGGEDVRRRIRADVLAKTVEVDHGDRTLHLDDLTWKSETHGRTPFYDVRAATWAAVVSLASAVISLTTSTGHSARSTRRSASV